MTQTPQHQPERVLLVGCGQVGTELGQRLIADGSEVFGLRRDPSGLPAGFHRLAVDLVQPVTQPLPHVDAMVITLTPSMHDPAGGAGYLVALQHLADALAQLPERVIFVSSTRVFEGVDSDRTVTEADAVAPVSDRGHRLVDGERLAVELFGAHIVRPAGIYGPGRDMLIRKVVDHEPVHYARRTNRIHQTDFVRALQTLLTVETAPKVLHAIDRTPGVPLGEVVTHIASRLGLEPPPPIEPAERSGRVLGGDRLYALLGSLTYPTYQYGYDHIIADRETTS